MDQWSRIEAQETNPYIYGQFIFHKGGMNTKWVFDE
jgi:hypothetical protein